MLPSRRISTVAEIDSGISWGSARGNEKFCTGVEQLQVAIYTGGCTAGQVGRKGAGDPSGHQAEYEPETCSYCKNNETYSGLD